MRVARPQFSWAARAAACGVFCFSALGATVQFNRDIRPILSDRCYACHGPDSANRKANLRFDTDDGSRAVVAAGDPAHSKLIERVTSPNKARRMPPAYAGKDPLTTREIDLLRSWVEQGAVREPHWSFIPPRRPALPPVSDRTWVRNPIDAFILARLDREGLKPSPEADPATLLRRVSLDLTGLPPVPGEFVHTNYEQAVDRLLASPRYGERMAVRWLDAARYADTNGYQSDGQRSMWRWRDWVIDAFNRNMPFDQFTIEQLAGDLLPNATLSQKIATGFHRNHRTNAEGGIVPEEFRVEYVADRAETTSIVWLGLTMGCARCHDHKFDPIKQRDFYRLFAYFNNVPEKGLVYNFGNEEPMIKAPTPDQERRLAELEMKSGQADRAFAALQPALKKAQSEWERRAADGPSLDWSPRQGLLVDRPQQADLDGQGFIDGGDTAQFDYQDPFTLAAWVRPQAPDGAIVTRVEDYWEGEGWGLYLVGGKLRLHIIKRWTDIGLRVETEDPVALDRWTHVAATYDGYRYASGVKLYVNGKEQKLKVLFDDLNYPLGAKDPLRIGGGGGAKIRFRGSVRGVKVFQGALRPDQVSTLSVTETVDALARMAPAQRSGAQSNKLALCFLDQYAPRAIRQARAEADSAQNARRKYYDSIQTVMVMRESATPRDAYILKRGAYDAPGEKVTAGAPGFLPGWNPAWRSNRLGLARWIVSPDNPLTARVLVNRLWQMYFGVGLVKTVDDFGAQGEAPSHPELLDWLATELVQGGWNVKALQRMIVTSGAYRQRSNTNPELLQRDPENRLIARGPRVRLSAEMIRDQALAVSGLLVEQLGGPSVNPYQPPGLWQELAGGKGYKQDHGSGLYRRSLYTYWKRTVAPPSMVNFDAPTRETCTVREVRTNTPLQALDLMNNVAFVETARKLGERMLAEGGADPAKRISYGYQIVLGRQPKPAETEVMMNVLSRFQRRYQENPEAAMKFLAAGEAPRDSRWPAPELAAYSTAASILLNLDETITKE